jgi:curved DNA-binding protein CbpA
MADQVQDHYAVLGVSKAATAADIKAAYNSLVLIHHPDKGGDQETFIKVQQAYEVLRDPESREAYDREQRRAEARKAQEKTKTKKAEDKQKTRKEAPAGRGEREERKPQGQRMPKEHRDRDEGRKQANPRDAPQQQRRRRADSFFADDSFFSDDEFTFQVFDDFKGFAAGFQFPPDKNRSVPQARTRARDQPPKSPKSPKNAPAEARREKVRFKRAEEAPRNQRDRGCPKDCGEKSPPKDGDQKSPTKDCGEKSPPRNRGEPHPQHQELTFEALLSGATGHSEQFNHAYRKLHATMGSHSSRYTDLLCHLLHLKDLLSKRILSVMLAQQDHTVLELRQGLKEGTLKPSKDIISKLSSKIESDHGCLKETANLMLKAYESAKGLRDPTKKHQGFIDSECPADTVGLDSALRLLQKHLTKNLCKP